MNAKTFRQSFRANISCPSNLQNISITATTLKSSDNWADAMRDNGRKAFCSFHFDNGTTYGLHFAAFELFLMGTPFYYCEGVEMETRTRNGHLEVFIYANKKEVAKWEKILSDRKAEELAQEAAELDQAQAEYEAAQAENEAEEVIALPENITFADTDTPEDQQFWKPDYYGRKLYNNGYITYIWGSYSYGANCREGLVYCDDTVIAEDVESAQDAYEIAREHFYKWEYTQVQSAQQSDANTPQATDIGADVTYININQAPDLGETTAEQMQDNTPQEDAETSEPFLELAHPDSLTDTEIADFFEEFDIDTYGGFKIGSGGSMWKFVPANIEAEEQTVIFYFKNPYSFECGALVLAKYFQCKEAEYRAAYSAFYEHHQKIAGVTIHEETACTLGVPTGVEAAERQVDYILHHDIRCECLGLFGEYLDNARVVKYWCSLTGKPKYKAYQEVNGRLLKISNVNYLRPKSDLNLHREKVAILDRQANLIKKSEQ